MKILEGATMEKSIKEIIYDETKARLEEMSSPQYQIPEKANKADYTGIVAVGLLCLVLIALCLMGVIS